MRLVKEVKPLEPYRLWLRFDDGVAKEVDIAPYLYGPVFEPVKKKEFFGQVRVDSDLGTICWPNGADLCADVLYSQGAPA